MFAIDSGRLAGAQLRRYGWWLARQSVGERDVQKLLWGARTTIDERCT